MSIFVGIGAGIVGVLILYVVVVLPLRIDFIRALRKMDRPELEGLVYRYELEYFNYIGHENPDVKTFKSLVDNRDLPQIKRRWGTLRRSFGKLERKAGHRGRPMIMDYYKWYELAVRELGRRGR